jgi:hypothetical protein
MQCCLIWSCPNGTTHNDLRLQLKICAQIAILPLSSKPTLHHFGLLSSLDQVDTSPLPGGGMLGLSIEDTGGGGVGGTAILFLVSFSFLCA